MGGFIGVILIEIEIYKDMLKINIQTSFRLVFVTDWIGLSTYF